LNEESGAQGVEPVALSDFDRRAVRATQDDLPLVDEPFAPACAALGMSFSGLREWFEAMKGKGVLRRIAAILRHRRAGFTANGMVAWCVPEGAIEAAGQTAASFEAVSHCYQRPAYEDWPYHLYTDGTRPDAGVVPGHRRSDCRVAAAAGDASAPHPLQHPEYKKERVRYFCEDAD
jgi:DNA-binding Lrp family transcriptional regulator